MNREIFFLVIASLAVSPFVFHYAFANHVTGQDDIFYWREHDVDNINSVWCTFDGITPTGTEISLQCEGGVFNGTTRTGALYIMKVFDKADLRSGALTNVFTWTYDHTCTEATCGKMNIVVMDGAYTHSSLTEPGGFVPNANWDQTNSVSCAGAPTTWEAAGGASFYCMGDTTTDLGNIIGAGDLSQAGITINFGDDAASNTKANSITNTVSITNALWNESTQSQVTLFLFNSKVTGVTNDYIRPRSLTITNTPIGTMTWNFPETAGEATNWDSYLGDVYQQNATESDHGYFYSYDPFVPDPPTNLSAFVDTSDIDLDWDAPAFVGYSPITGYKIERESPVGGGFSVIVANTGNTNTYYSDTSIVVGTEYNYRVSALNTYGSSIPSNESVDGNPPAPSTDTTPDYDCPSTLSSFELFIKAITSTSIGVCWDDDVNSSNSSGYQINYTSPYGDPLTVIVNDTLAGDTRTYLLTNLQPHTPYSIQIQTWPKLIANQTNIANATTLGSEFDIGDFTVNAGTNPTHVDFKFIKTLLNDTTTQLDVEFTNTINPSCNFEYRFAGTNQTYTNLASGSSYVDDNTNSTSFIFNNVQYEVIKARCYDGDNSATYIITQESYPLLEQIQAFRDGSYGTSGQIGAFDLVTLVAIILSMIGFNRVNAIVGVIMSIIIVGALATLQIIQWPVILLSALALVTMLAFISHSRDDVTE